MRYGVNIFIWSADYNPSVAELFPAIKAGGFDGVEVPIFRPADFQSAHLRKALEANDLGATAVTVLVEGLNVISPDADIRKRSIADFADKIKAIADAGIQTLAGPMYSPVGYLPGRRRTTDEWNWAVEAFQAVTPVLDATGVSLAIEPLNRFETYFLNTVADGVALCDAIAHPKVGMLVDTFHANIEEKDIATAYRMAARHLKHVHTCENDRGIPGSGHIEWPSIVEAIHSTGYDGWLTIESFGFALGEISAAASIWRDIEKSPETIAYEGVQFLRKAFARGTA
ncbi:isomerase [Bryobacterales bacterium F-183]|nr:isomerase [Bryobacterales bacterium F-183]